MGNVVLFAGVDPVQTGESDYPWHPLSVLAIGTALQAAGHHPVLIDCQVDPDWEDDLRNAAPGALFVGVTCMTGPSIRNVLRAIAITRQAAPGTPVVWGGYHATLAYRGILREKLADIVVLGPGEAAAVGLADLADRTGALTGSGLGQIPNLAYVDAEGRLPQVGTGGATLTRYEFTGDMNALPPLDYALIDVPAYFTPDQRVVSYITSYGCPYGCAFCSEPTVSTRRWRALAPPRVAAELHQLWQRYAPDRIDLLDPNFSTNIHRVIEIVGELERDGTPPVMRTTMRSRDIVNLARHLDLRRLRAAGFSSIFIGCESGSDRMLKLLNKGATVADTIRACELLDAAGIAQLTSWIHDLPGEEVEDSEQTLTLAARLASLRGNQQKHHFFTPFPSTELYEQLYGKTTDDGRTQAEWADSDTYAATALWSGRPEFRRRVRDRLEGLRARHPAALSRALPRLEERV